MLIHRVIVPASAAATKHSSRRRFIGVVTSVAHELLAL